MYFQNSVQDVSFLLIVKYFVCNKIFFPALSLKLIALISTSLFIF